jgi:hypothetical protein
MRENPDDQRGLFDRSDDLQFAATLIALDRLFRVYSVEKLGRNELMPNLF